MRAFLLCLPLIMLTSGCFWETDSRSDLEQFVIDTQNKPRGRIDPIPTFQPYEFFSYGAVGLRSPFEAEKIEEKNKNKVMGDDVQPDFDRRKEHLENYNLSLLSMTGSIKMANAASLYALVKDGDGGVVKVKVGDYMGQNHGRIVAIDEQRINLIEIVPNGVGGWLERPRTLALDGLAGE